MDEEDKLFYENQMDFFGQRNDEGQYSNYQAIPLVSPLSVENEPQSNGAYNSTLFRAFNPLDRLRSMPEDKQNQYSFMFNNHKRFNGIQHFFEFGSQDKFSQQFLQNIEMDALGNNNNPNFELDKLFHGQKTLDYKEDLHNMIVSLNKKIEETNQKIMQSVNINRTISHTFYEHFTNFSMVLNDTQFFHQFEKTAKNMVVNCKKATGPGIELITSIHQFWMKSFKDFVNEIWKYSSKFTLNFFKRDQPQECSSENIEMRSQSSNTMGSKDKRKGWSKEETQIIQQFIDSNVIFSQSVLKKLSLQFNRSINSISSKIQKINKGKKGKEDISQESLLKKTLQILKMHPQGLNRQVIIQKMNQNYEMGYGGQWQKSVGQLLSSRKQFVKLKSKHKLLNPEHYKQLNVDEHDKTKLTFKDKVVQIFLNCPNAEADLKTLVDRYAALFEDVEDDTQTIREQRKKSIEANISKTLSRYEIFDREAKTLYLINPLYAEINTRNMEVQVQSFFQF